MTQIYDFRAPTHDHCARSPSRAASSPKGDSHRQMVANENHKHLGPSRQKEIHAHHSSGYTPRSGSSSQRMSISAPASRRSAEPGRFMQGSIPGYCGFVPGRYSEDIHAATYKEANLAARETCMRRGKRPADMNDSGILSGSIERGAINCTVGAMGDTGPHDKTLTMFHNARGHQPRAGASIPGYAGVIPGKFVGNVFGRRFAMDNIQATQVRHDNHKGLEYSTNWILHAENDKKQKDHGSGVIGHAWQVTEPWKSGRRGVTRNGSSGPTGWKLNEPRSTHEFLRY